jgi:hypothetical protein
MSLICMVDSFHIQTTTRRLYLHCAYTQLSTWFQNHQQVQLMASPIQKMLQMKLKSKYHYQNIY